MTHLIEAPDFYRLFLFSGAGVGFLVSSVCTLYVYWTLQRQRDASRANSDRRLMVALYRLSALDDVVLLYYAAYFFYRLSADVAPTQTGLLYYAAVSGYILAIFALALPGISAAFIARSLNRGKRRMT